MRKASCLTLFLLWPFVASLFSGGLHLRSTQDISHVDQQASCVFAEHRPKGDANRDFLECFTRLPPQKRVQLWEETLEGKNKTQPINCLLAEMENLIIGNATDTVPALAQLVMDKSAPTRIRVQAVIALSNMDRYVPLEKSLIMPPDWASVPEVNQLGTWNTLSNVNGRRIGTQGLESLQWAATEGDRPELKFFARLFLGLMERELRSLSLDEQVLQWKRFVPKKTALIGVVPYGDEKDYSFKILNSILIEKAPESVDPIAQILRDDSNSYVREAAIRLLGFVDGHRVRLRGIPSGQTAIEAVKRALEVGRLKPEFDSREKRQEAWKNFSAQFYDDDVPLFPNSQWEFFARALHSMFGDDTIEPEPHAMAGFTRAKSEIRPFVTYLTKQDPFFPSWEYTFVGGSPNEQALHPGFPDKIRHLHDQWLSFLKTQTEAH